MFRKKNENPEFQKLSLERRDYLRKTKRDKFLVNGTKVLILVMFFALWEIAGNLGWIDSFIMSQPSRVVKSIVNLYREGTLFTHIGISCLETIVGFLLGTVVGTLIAIVMWWSPFVSKVMEPYLVVLNAMPKVALGPIIIVWAGSGQKSIIIMALAISLVVTIMEVLGGFVATEQEKIKLLRTFGANRFQIFTKVVLPANYSTIVNSLKINVGLSWVGVITGEFLISKAGIGYLITYGSQVFQMDLVMASVLILTVAAAVMYQGILLLEKILIRKND